MTRADAFWCWHWAPSSVFLERWCVSQISLLLLRALNVTCAFCLFTWERCTLGEDANLFVQVRHKWINYWHVSHFEFTFAVVRKGAGFKKRLARISPILLILPWDSSKQWNWHLLYSCIAFSEQISLYNMTQNITLNTKAWDDTKDIFCQHLILLAHKI